MALSSKSIFLYGLQVTELNSSIDFRAVNAGPILMATLRLGYYSLAVLCTEVARAMREADQNNNYSVTTDRSIGGGTQNRTSIETDGSFLEILFGTGPRAASGAFSLIGFLGIDYTGSTSYTGSSSAGTMLESTLVGYNYLSPDFDQKVFGSVNVSASGAKEAIVYSIQQFTQVQFKYEPKQKVITKWKPFLQWAILQREFDFTPEISSPNTFYEVTMESTSGDGKGLAYKMTEMLPRFPNLYDTGSLRMRLKGD